MNPFRRKPAMPDPEVPDDALDELPQDADAEQAARDDDDDAPDEGAYDDADGGAEAELERVRAEKDALFERLARAQADFQNAERRIARDSEQRLSAAIGGFLRELLPVADTLERALQVSPDAGAAAVLDGVRGTHGQFMQVLKKHGLERIEPDRGTAFDPNRHEALMQQPDEEFDTPTVLQMYQAGYALGGRVIRPAQVVVSQAK